VAQRSFCCRGPLLIGSIFALCNQSCAKPTETARLDGLLNANLVVVLELKNHLHEDFERLTTEPVMLSKEYLQTAQTLFRVARDMADQTIADRLKSLAQDYERRAEQASQADAAAASRIARNRA
jgi:hypothetical protein